MEDSIFYRIPPLVRLDTTARGRRGRTLSPDIDYPHPSRFPGTPLWTVERDTLFLLWSNGFTPTRVHAPLGVGPLRGVAIAMSDAMNAAPLPSATIRLDRVPCPPP